MHPEHRALLAALTAAGRPADGFDARGYLGSDHAMLRVPVPERRRIAKAWVKAHKALAPAEVLEIVDSLIRGASHEEKTLGPLILEACRSARAAVRPDQVDRWLDQLVGWAEIDSLCQSTFAPDEMLA